MRYFVKMYSFYHDIGLSTLKALVLNVYALVFSSVFLNLIPNIRFKKKNQMKRTKYIIKRKYFEIFWKKKC